MRKDVRLGWRPDLPDHRDFRFRSSFDPALLPARVDLTETYAVPVVDQGNLGSCTGNGIASALAYLQEKEGAPMVYPSRLFIYYNERVMEGTVNSDAGAEIRDGIKSVVDLGYCPETDWPYDIGVFSTRPSALAYSNALRGLVRTYQKVDVGAAALQQALASGYPVVVGFTVYDSFYNHSDGTINLPTVSDGIAGGHCVIVVGYDQTSRRFKFQNSWGTGWGTRGFGTIPFEYLGSPNFGGDYWIITGDSSVTHPDPQPDPAPPPKPGCLPMLGLLPGSLISKFLG